MENREMPGALGKNRDKESKENDIAKKQSEANPASENLDMMPNSVNKNGDQGFSQSKDNDTAEIHNKAEEYAKEEHDKAKNWENIADKENNS